MIERERDIGVPVIGAILLATDLTTERDIRALVPIDIPVCVTRIPFENPTVPANLKNTLPHLSAAAALLVPGAKLSALYFSCTSASTTLGEEAVNAAISQTCPGVTVVTPIGAAKQALRAIDASRIAVMTPYVAETTQVIVDHFAANGFDVTGQFAMEYEDDRDMAVIDPEDILNAARMSIAPGAEAVFISCTALPAARIVPYLEKELGLPVVTSNLAGIWLSLRLAGWAAPRPELGVLMGFGPGRDAA
jgi:maleate isomerase